MTKLQEAFSLREAAEVLGVHVETVRRLIHKKALRAAKVARDWRVSKADLNAYYQSKGGGKLFEDVETGGGIPKMKTVTVKEFSERLKLPPESVREWCRKGRLKCLKLQGCWLIPEKELDLWSGTFAALRKGKKKG